MSERQCIPWSDAAFCGVWSGSTLFAQAIMSKSLEYILYSEDSDIVSMLIWILNDLILDEGPFPKFSHL